jgi:hypothetical protein
MPETIQEPIQIPERFGIFLRDSKLRQRIQRHAWKYRARSRNAAIVDLLNRATSCEPASTVKLSKTSSTVAT